MIEIVYPYYNNHAAFDAIKEKLSLLPCKITIVDDGSNPALQSDIKNIRIMRIEGDKPWNQANANNIGIRSIDQDSVVLRMDIDHYIEPDDFPIFEKIAKTLPEKTIVNFKRYRKDSECVINCGCNIFLMRRQDFVDIGGYDESFCGNYGYEDKEMLFRAKHKGYQSLVSDDCLIYVNGLFPTRGLNRNIDINKEKFEHILEKHKISLYK